MIGIFGDSFADTNPDTGGAGIGWPLLLNEEIENFAIVGTSIAYSYDMFCRQDLTKYSKVIFIATEPHRMHFIDKERNKELLFNGKDAKSSWAVNDVFNYSSYENTTPLSSMDKKILKWQESITAMYPDTWESMANAMKNDVRHSHRNVLVLSINELVQIVNLDAPHNKWWEDYIETSRKCHLSSIQNIELANYIKDYFEHGFDIHSILAKDKVKDYFTKANSLEEAGYKKIK